MDREFRLFRLSMKEGEGAWKLFYRHYYDFLRQWKMVKVDLENIITSYYQITEVFESVLSIQQHYWKKIKNITVRPGSKHDIQIEKWSSQRKIFYITKLKEKNKFLGYLAILKLSRKKYITQKWERRGLLWREVAAELISTTTYYRNGYIWKKVAWQCSLYYQLSRNFFNTWFRGPLIR